ncbi:MAG: hypothetical protein ACF8AM_03700, partial [Rhodopirellula sp. JB055]|uniref:hypothetical protein n=1 Tax=Rhodopirellula sp. JB055 TaxID=3342846 RepID=UPI00370A6CDD
KKQCLTQKRNFKTGERGTPLTPTPAPSEARMQSANPNPTRERGTTLRIRKVPPTFRSPDA